MKWLNWGLLLRHFKWEATRIYNNYWIIKTTWLTEKVWKTSALPSWRAKATNSPRRSTNSQLRSRRAACSPSCSSWPSSPSSWEPSFSSVSTSTSHTETFSLGNTNTTTERPILRSSYHSQTLDRSNAQNKWNLILFKVLFMRIGLKHAGSVPCSLLLKKSQHRSLLFEKNIS